MSHAFIHPALGAALLSASMALATCGVKMLDLPVASSVVGPFSIDFCFKACILELFHVYIC